MFFHYLICKLNEVNIELPLYSCIPWILFKVCIFSFQNRPNVKQLFTLNCTTVKKPRCYATLSYIYLSLQNRPIVKQLFFSRVLWDQPRRQLNWNGGGGGMDSQYKLLSELLSDQAAFITSPKTSLANYWGGIAPLPPVSTGLYGTLSHETLCHLNLRATGKRQKECMSIYYILSYFECKHILINLYSWHTFPLREVIALRLSQKNQNLK